VTSWVGVKARLSENVAGPPTDPRGRCGRAQEASHALQPAGDDPRRSGGVADCARILPLLKPAATIVTHMYARRRPNAIVDDQGRLFPEVAAGAPARRRTVSTSATAVRRINFGTSTGKTVERAHRPGLLCPTTLPRPELERPIEDHRGGSISPNVMSKFLMFGNLSLSQIIACATVQIPARLFPVVRRPAATLKCRRAGRPVAIWSYARGRSTSSTTTRVRAPASNG